MKLAKALKLKNLKAGRCKKSEEIMQRENVQLDENVSQYDVATMYQDYVANLEELAKLKASILRANGNIWDSLMLIGEYKTAITFLQELKKTLRQGRYMESGGYGQPAVPTVFTPQLDTVFVNSEIHRLEDLIVILQDDIDDYNHREHTDVPKEKTPVSSSGTT